MNKCLDIERIRHLRPQNDIHYFRTIGSTMTEGGKLAQAGAPHGTVILADEQTAGQGRLGRAWISEAGVGIYCTTLLRLPIAADKLPLTSLVLGLATAEAIQQTAGVACDLRWPNDVLIGLRKVAGILTVYSDGCVIAGVGVNVHQEMFPADLRTPATSLWLETGEQQDREALIAALLESLDGFSLMLATQGGEAILQAFTAASSYVLDRHVILEGDGKRAFTRGLDRHGFLRVQLENGHFETLQAGAIRPDFSRV